MSINSNAGMIADDKQKHMAVGALLDASMHVLSNDKAIRLTVPLFAGIAKELYDKSKGFQFDWQDVGATVLGGIVIEIVW